MRRSPEAAWTDGMFFTFAAPKTFFQLINIFIDSGVGTLWNSFGNVVKYG
jgi:hypothetical protein